MLYRTYKGGIRLTTQQIRFFLEAAECLNFTEAAKRLFVAQSTLSKQIALLEDELGLKLFYRSNRTVGLTPAGRELALRLASRWPEVALWPAEDLPDYLARMAGR